MEFLDINRFQVFSEYSRVCSVAVSFFSLYCLFWAQFAGETTRNPQDFYSKSKPKEGTLAFVNPDFRTLAKKSLWEQTRTPYKNGLFHLVVPHIVSSALQLLDAVAKAWPQIDFPDGAQRLKAFPQLNKFFTEFDKDEVIPAKREEKVAGYVVYGILLLVQYADTEEELARWRRILPKLFIPSAFGALCSLFTPFAVFLF